MELLSPIVVMLEGLGFNLCVVPFLNVCVPNLLQGRGQSVGTHMLICIYAPSQSKYISVFSLILFLYYFPFIVCTLFQFFPNFSLFFLPFYSLQKPVTLTQHCWFCFRLSARVPARRAESNCIMRSLRCGEWSWSRGRKQGICGLRHPLAIPSSVFWQSLRRREPIVSLPLLY